MRLRLRMGLLALLAVAAFPAFAAGNEAPCGTAPAASDDWPVAAPAEVGLDPALLCSIGEKLAAPDHPNLHGVVVVRHGKLVYEAYASGADRQWGADLGVVAYDATLQHDVRSVTKSVVSLLLGIAIDRGLIAGVDAPMLPYFPEYAELATPALERITLRHLLTMTAGFAWNEDLGWVPANTERQMYEAADPYRYVLERPLVHEPDERWVYNGGASLLLGAVLKKAVGMSLDSFARENLFEPLGIDDYTWMTLNNGDPIASGGLRLRPRDMAKLGQLVLDGGTWNGRRVVSQEWIAASTTPRFDAEGLRYGYHWWMGRSLLGSGTFEWVAAFGLGGQRIFIVPRADLVVVVTAGLYRDESQGYYARAILEGSVLPAIRDPAPQ